MSWTIAEHFEYLYLDILTNALAIGAQLEPKLIEMNFPSGLQKFDDSLVYHQIRYLYLN